MAAYGPVPARNTEVELFSVAGVDGFLREVNTRFAQLLGLEVDGLAERSLLELVHPDDIPEVVAGLAALEAGASEVLLENRFRQHDGGWTHLQWVARPLPDTDLWWAAGRDTTPYHRVLAQGAELQARLDVAVGRSTAAMWDLDTRSGRLTWEAEAAPLLGVSPEGLPDSPERLALLAAPAERPAVLAGVAAVRAGGDAEVEFSVGDGPGRRHLALRGKVLEHDRRGRPVRAVGLLFDHTTERAMEEQLMRMVLTDALTGAPNRRAFEQTLRTEWRQAVAEQRPLSVCIVDIDNFKTCNDTLGHLVGDVVITTVSRCLAAAVEATPGLLARFGGEEFAVVLPGLDQEAAGALADQLCERVRDVRIRQAPSWRFSVSVGVATRVPTDSALKATQLVSRADQALYVAKSSGKDQVISYESALAGRAAVEEAIRAGLAAGQFVMHYQPLVEIHTGQVTGFEALMRWDRPSHGRVAPDQFIPVAEQSDLICELGRMALAQACGEAASWATAGLHGLGRRLRVAVNLSGRHVAKPHVVHDVTAALAMSELPPECLEVELTETALADGALLVEHLAAIRRLGVVVAIDDFGTGYTSVGQLPNLPADVLKIDRSFVASRDRRTRALVTLMIDAAHAFDLVVVAEGVEDVRHLDALAAWGCDEAQGYAIARPMPAGELGAWLAAWDPSRVRPAVS